MCGMFAWVKPQDSTRKQELNVHYARSLMVKQVKFNKNLKCRVQRVEVLREHKQSTVLCRTFPNCHFCLCFSFDLYLVSIHVLSLVVSLMFPDQFVYINPHASVFSVNPPVFTELLVLCCDILDPDLVLSLVCVFWIAPAITICSLPDLCLCTVPEFDSHLDLSSCSLNTMPLLHLHPSYLSSLSLKQFFTDITDLKHGSSLRKALGMDLQLCWIVFC